MIIKKITKQSTHYIYAKLLLVVFYVIISQISIAKEYSLTQISSREGLSQQDVQCMIQDKLGFIWIGTYDGLNRYDGNSFVLFRNNTNNSKTISDNRIYCLKEWPKRDEIWFGTDGGGLNCYNIKTQKIMSFFVSNRNKFSLLDNEILSLEQENNNLWVATNKGINKITFTSQNEIIINQYILYGKNNETVSQRTNTIVHDNQGNIVAGTDHGFYIKSQNGNKFNAVNGKFTNIKQIVKDRAGNLWVVTNVGILYFSLLEQKKENYLSFPQFISFNIENPENLRSILPISNQKLLLSTTNKVYWIGVNNNNFKIEKSIFINDTFFENNTLKALLLDQSMNIWISSEMDGVAKFDLNSKGISQLQLKQIKSIDKLFIQSLLKDYQGRLWIGSNIGVLIEDFKNGKSVKIKSIEGKIIDIMEDNMKNIWITSVTDVYFVPGGNVKKIISIRQQHNFQNLASHFIGPFLLLEDFRNNLWLSFREGIMQITMVNNSFSSKFYNFRNFKNISPSNYVTKLFFDKKENLILIGTKNSGLLKAKLSDKGEIKTIQSISNSQNSKIEHVWSIYQAFNGVIYVGTDSGLKKLITKKGNQNLEFVSNDSRLKTFKITSIVGDNNQNLWLSTSFGLISYNINTQIIKQFFISDGLSTNILTEGSLFDTNGLLYVGSIKGINIIDLKTLKPNKVLPQTQLIAIRINNNSVKPKENFNGRILLENSLEYTNSIKLKYYENNFTIEFAALHFSNPSKNKFSYKLNGFSNNWTEVNNNIRSATFTNVPSGKYKLEVRSSNCDEVWNNTSKILLIQILPAPWKTIWAYLLYFLIICIVVYYLFRYYNDRQKLNYQLMEEQFEHKKDLEIVDEKLKYNTNITHELRTPLTLITAPAEELLEKSYDDEFLNSRLHIIKNNADRLIQLIGQFLDFRKLINEKYTLNIRKNNLHQLLLNIVDNFYLQAKLKKLTIDLFYDMNIEECWFDKEIVNKICFNLLSNAIKNTPSKEKISIYASLNKDETHLLLSVEDTGIGISETEIGKIFDRFYQVPGTIGGTGIGLNLCKNLATLHLGEIRVKSRIGEGSIFTLEIPISKDAYNENIITNNQNQINIDDEIETSQFIVNDYETEPLILIIEDNLELRDYIVNLLSEQSKVLVAENGEEGLKIAINNLPDIVISDIMMPVMDGIEFTQKCKNNINTSHIPIILLTAKVTQESQIEGLSYGADDYITKPFNPQILKLKVNNLIKLTKDKKEKAGEDIEMLNERDQKFIATFEKIVLDNYSANDFGIDKICQMMAISRMQLYRKMTSIINKKPSQFIKEIKMKKAFQLIKEKGMNINETMNELEYTNYTHFTKLFSEVNGISPRKLLGMKD